MPKMLQAFTAIALLALITLPTAQAETVSKNGDSSKLNPPPGSDGSTVTADYNFNTGGVLDFAPTTGGSSAGWGEWFITTVENTIGTDITLIELGFPCAGPTGGVHGWVVWLEAASLEPPTGRAQTAVHHGSFVPADADPTSLPPTTYSFIDISAAGIVVPPGAYFTFGYENTGMGGQTAYNGVATWAWYNNTWDPDQGWSRTAILQVKGNLGGAVPIAPVTWGRIKQAFH